MKLNASVHILHLCISRIDLIDRGNFPRSFYAICHRAPHGFWHGRTGTAIRGCSHHGCRLLPTAIYGALLPPDAADLSCNTPHRMDALRRNCHGFSSRSAHTCGVQQGHGRTSRSGGSPAFHVPRRNVLLSGGDIRGKNTASSVSLAPASPPHGIKKSLCWISPAKT